MFEAKSVFAVTVRALADGKIDASEAVEIKKAIAASNVALRREPDPDMFAYCAAQNEAAERIIAASSPMLALTAPRQTDPNLRDDVGNEMRLMLAQRSRAQGIKLKTQLSTALADRQIDRREAAAIQKTIAEGVALESEWLPGSGERPETLATVARDLLKEATQPKPLDELLLEVWDKNPSEEELVRIAVLRDAAAWSFDGSNRAIAEASRLSIKAQRDIQVSEPHAWKLSIFHPDGSVTNQGERKGVTAR